MSISCHNQHGTIFPRWRTSKTMHNCLNNWDEVKLFAGLFDESTYQYGRWNVEKHVSKLFNKREVENTCVLYHYSRYQRQLQNKWWSPDNLVPSSRTCSNKWSKRFHFNLSEILKQKQVIDTTQTTVIALNSSFYENVTVFTSLFHFSAIIF